MTYSLRLIMRTRYLMMKIIYNNIIPFKGFSAINICGLVFARNRFKPLSEYTINHEAIHTAQMREGLYIGFYILYIIEFLFKGYNNISFELEANKYEEDLNYLKIRKHYANYKRD